MAVALDVTTSQTPEFLCVVTALPCQTGGCTSQLAVSTLTAKGVLTRKSTTKPYRFDKEAIKDVHGLAFQNLKRAKDELCSEQHDLCQPELTIPVDPGANDQYITCGANDQPTGSQRVAFVHLRFETPASGAAVKSIKLTGNAATVTLNAAVTSKYVFARVVGGDFAELPDAAIGTAERVNVTLHPRCDAYAVQLPPRAPTVRVGKEKSHASVALATSGGKTTCHSGPAIGSAFTVMIPYRDDGKEKTIRVTAQTIDKAQDSEFEASWTSPAPPRPILLGYREVSLQWRRHCLMAAPPEGAEALQAKRIRDDVEHSVEATTTCPQIALVAAGTSCVLDDKSATSPEPAVCSYRCRAPSTIPAFTLPSPVRFSRWLGKGNDSRIVATWTDSLDYAGQELSSYEDAATRSLIVRLRNRAHWKSTDGDVRRGVQIDIGGIPRRIDLDEQTKKPPLWFKLNARGLECADPVRVSIDGTREYWPQVMTTQAGIIVLDDPKTYRRQRRFGGAVGAQVGGPLRVRDFAQNGAAGYGWPDRPEPMLGAQVWLENYSEWCGAGAFELSGDYHVGRMGYRGVTLLGAPDENHPIWYQRFEGKLKHTWWRSPQFHWGIGVGGGFGTPLWSEQRDVVGDYNGFLAFEPYVRFRSPYQTNLAIEVALAARLGEKRWYFHTDFLGDSTLYPMRSFDLAIEIRLRFGGG